MGRSKSSGQKPRLWARNFPQSRLACRPWCPDWDRQCGTGSTSHRIICHPVHSNRSPLCLFTCLAATNVFRLDITDCYKYPEGSTAERASLLGEAAGEEAKVASDSDFSLTLDESFALGEALGFTRNVGGEPRSVEVSLSDMDLDCLPRSASGLGFRSHSS